MKIQNYCDNCGKRIPENQRRWCSILCMQQKIEEWKNDKTPRKDKISYREGRWKDSWDLYI